MVYKVIGLMSGSSLDGLDIAYVHLQERAGTTRQSTQPVQGTQASQSGQSTQSAHQAAGPRTWDFQFIQTACYPYSSEWRQRLAEAPRLPALDYQLLHTEYGHYLGEQVLRFIEEHGLQYQVQLIASHGHTAFHLPSRKMTAQLGDGAALAATTRINTVSDLRSMDLALGGQGAPIVPVGELLLLPGYDLFLNLGGIANLSRRGGAAGPGSGSGSGRGDAEGVGSGPGSGSGRGDAVGPGSGPDRGDRGFVAFDVCPAGRVLNELAGDKGLAFDKDGALAAAGRVDEALLQRLNALPYYSMEYPKSLDNGFGTETVLPLIRAAGLSTEDALRTYAEHIAEQISISVSSLVEEAPVRLLVTGGGAHNTFLVGRIKERLAARVAEGSAARVAEGLAARVAEGSAAQAAEGPEPRSEEGLTSRIAAGLTPGIEVVVPDNQLTDFKEALVMALIGVLRWREENNVLASVTGAARDSIGGAVWIGQEA